MQRLTLFDLDHTLLDGNSDVLWCEFLMGQGVLDRAAFGERNAAMERDYRAGTVGAQAFCDFYVSTLAGGSAGGWAPLCEAFLTQVVVPRLWRLTGRLREGRRRSPRVRPAASPGPGRRCRPPTTS